MGPQMEPVAGKGQRTFLQVGYTKRMRTAEEEGPRKLRTHLNPELQCKQGWKEFKTWPHGGLGEQLQHATKGRGAGEKGAGARAQSQGRMLLHMEAEARAGAKGGAGGRGQVSPWSEDTSSS